MSPNIFRRGTLLAVVVISSMSCGLNGDPKALEHCVATELREELVLSELKAAGISYQFPEQDNQQYKRLFTQNYDPYLSWVCVRNRDKEIANRIYSKLQESQCAVKCCRKTWRNIGEAGDKTFLTDRNEEVKYLLGEVRIPLRLIEGSCSIYKEIEWCAQHIEWLEEDNKQVISILKANDLWFWKDCAGDI